MVTCSSYKTLLAANRETPEIISLFKELNSRLFRGQAAQVQQAPSPSPDVTDPVLFDASMQSVIASLQSRVINGSSSAQPVTIEYVYDPPSSSHYSLSILETHALLGTRSTCTASLPYWFCHVTHLSYQVCCLCGCTY